MAAVGITLNVVIPEPLHGVSRQEVTFGIFGVGWRVTRSVCDWVDEQLKAYRRVPPIARDLGDNGGEIAPGAVAA
jgi:hypothetical protein